MGFLNQRASKQNLENVGDVVKKELEELGLHIVTCDEEGCEKSAVLVMGEVRKCDDHDKPYLLQKFMPESEKKEFIRKIVLDSSD